MPKAWASSITTSTNFCPSSFWRSSSLVGADQVDHGAVREPSRSAITGAALLPGRLVPHGHGVRSPIASRSGVEELRTAGTELVTVADGIALDGPAAEVILAVMAWAAKMAHLAIHA